MPILAACIGGGGGGGGGIEDLMRGGTGRTIGNIFGGGLCICILPGPTRNGGLLPLSTISISGAGNLSCCVSSTTTASLP